MSVKSTDIEKIAVLARIRVAASDVPEVATRINDILGMVDAMQDVDTQGVEPMANPHDAVARLRADTVIANPHREQFQAIAPQAENGLYLVPKVID